MLFPMDVSRPHIDVLRSDFCYSNVWNTQPSFPRLLSSPPPTSIPASISPALQPDQLRASHLFGTSSPIIPITHNLQTLTYLLSPTNASSHTKSSRMTASNLIYDTEYSLLALNPPYADVNSLNLALSNCAFTFESLPLIIALHLYLYLAIRLVPTTSQLVNTMALRLQVSLREVINLWDSDQEKSAWLLWMMWIGAIASRADQRWWFVEEVRRLCSVMGIWDIEGLKENLRCVLWEEEWCGGKAEEVWEEASAQGLETRAPVGLDVVDGFMTSDSFEYSEF